MTSEATCVSPISPTQFKLAKFSDRQRAVANTWADHFNVRCALRERFLLHYLTYTSSTRCWCLCVEGSEPSHQRVLARFGNQLQYFDGQRITSVGIQATDRVPVHAPTPGAALKIANRIMKDRNYGNALLTSFCKRAREIALAESAACLGVLHKWGHISDEGRNKRYFGPRNRFYITSIGSTLKRFCHYLDQELLHAVRSVKCPSAALYNWLAEGDRSRRMQALRSQPVLVPQLVMGEQLPWPRDPLSGVPAACPWPELQRFYAIDEDGGYEFEGQSGAMFIALVADHGLPLNKVLAWLLSQPLASIRYLGQQRVYDTGSALTHMAREGLEAGWHTLLAGSLLGNRRPTSKVQWRAFIEFRNSIPWQAATALHDLNSMLSGCPTDWADPAWQGMATKLEDLKEIFYNLEQARYSNVAKTTKRLKQFIASMSFRQISNLINAFHVALEAIRLELDQEFPQGESDALTRWLGLLTVDAVECPNGLSIVELRCPQDLNDEHGRLSHCIDTYDYRAYLGSCRLLSIRENNVSLASVELVRERRVNEPEASPWSTSHLTTAQIRGAYNASPQKRSPAQKAYDWFLNQIKTGQINVNLDWPNQTLQMRRYADESRTTRFTQILIRWINQYMDRGL